MTPALLVHVSRDMTAGDLLVGAGTLALAFFTAWLARRTSKEVSLTERGLDLNRESIEAIDRPFVIASPNGDLNVLGFVDGGSAHLGPRFAYRLWNIGKGPAIVDGVSLRDSQSGHEYLTELERLERPVAVSPGVRDELAPLSHGVPGVGAELSLRIDYRSGAGRRYRTESSVSVREGLLCICRDFRRLEGDVVASNCN